MRIILCAIIALTITTAQSTTFYVSSSGNDANTGTSISSPWKTPNHLYGMTFSPDDSILFKRGDTFEGAFNVTLRGTVGHEIVIGAYGTGNKPILRGDFSGRTWIRVSQGVYKMYMGSGSTVALLLQYVGGEWIYFGSNSAGERGSNPAEWPLWMDSLKVGRAGQVYTKDTLFIHTYGSIDLPGRDSIRFYRSQNFLSMGSHDAIIRDLDIRYISLGLTVENSDRIIVRKISGRNILGGLVYVQHESDNSLLKSRHCIVDSCDADTVGNTVFYARGAVDCIFRYNSVKNLITPVDGIPDVISGGYGGDRCGYGSQGSDTFNMDSLSNNLWEYNTADNIYGALYDFFFTWGDTMRYSTGTNTGYGLSPHGTDLVIHDNHITLKASSLSGMSNIGNSGTGKITFYNNVLLGYYDYAMWLQNPNGGTIEAYNNIFYTDKRYTDFVWINGSGINSHNNQFYGTGQWGNDPTRAAWYTTLSAFQSATSYESGSTWSATYTGQLPVEEPLTRTGRKLLRRK